MARKIVVFGATGYTGRLVVEELLARGEKPLAAGRSLDKLAALDAEIGPLDYSVADAGEPSSIAALLDPGDVLVSTVGPFAEHGEAAVEAATRTGAHYLDSTGEPAFIREVFTNYARRARGACALVTAFGFDYVPGNLAGGLALKRAGAKARRVDVGYFVEGPAGPDALSSGTIASAMTSMLEPSFSWRGSSLVDERGGKHHRRFTTSDGKARSGISVGGTEHWGLPRYQPNLEEVGVYLGWLGPASAPVSKASIGLAAASKIPGVNSLVHRATEPIRARSGVGPSAEARAKRSIVVQAVAYDADGDELATVELRGPEMYTFTGAILAWGAAHALEHGFDNSGALAPIDAFGLATLRQGCEEAGLVRA